MIFVTTAYVISINNDTPLMPVPRDLSESKKDELTNIKNPAESDQDGNANEQDNQVLEEPEAVVLESNKKRNVLPPPKVSTRFTGPTTSRQEAVVKAFKHSWNGYKQFAWGHDNLKPISATYYDWFGLGLTIVDSLDTILIMGLDKGGFRTQNRT